MKDAPLLALVLRARRRRIVMLIGFALLFLAAGSTARVAAGSDGHVEFDRLFQLGGYPLVSGMLLLGWLLGRFPLIAALVLIAGSFSGDLHDGQARMIYARPVSPVRIYLVRFGVLALTAFTLAAVLMPLFDVIMLGHWGGPNTLALIGVYVLGYGALTALLSVFTRADAWIALFLAVLAMVWENLRRANALESAPPGAREVVTFLLPPQRAFIAVETAFAESLAVPWAAVLYVAVYAALLLVIAGIVIVRREV